MILIIFPLLTTSCSCTYLEKKYVMKLKVNCSNENQSKYITISGISGHSALNITDITISDNTDSINILAKLELCRKKIGLPFYLKIKLRDKVDYISLGKDKDIIWQRSNNK